MPVVFIITYSPRHNRRSRRENSLAYGGMILVTLYLCPECLALSWKYSELEVWMARNI